MQQTETLLKLVPPYDFPGKDCEVPLSDES